MPTKIYIDFSRVAMKANIFEPINGLDIPPTICLEPGWNYSITFPSEAACAAAFEKIKITEPFQVGFAPIRHTQETEPIWRGLWAELFGRA